MGLAKVHCGATPPSVMVLLVLNYICDVGPRLTGNCKSLTTREAQIDSKSRSIVAIIPSQMEV